MSAKYYLVETKQLSGDWLATSKKHRSCIAAKAEADVQHAMYACPKRAVDSKGKVFYTVGDDKEWAEHCRRCADARFKFAVITQIRSGSEARLFIYALHAANKLFHFDDNPETIVECHSGLRTFTDEECEHLRRRVSEMFEVPDFDPFELAVELSQ